MSTNALAIASTVDSLIGRFRAHVHSRLLPAPAYVELDLIHQKASVYPNSAFDLASVLGSLLTWAYSLTNVTADWWRTPEDRLHITAHGRTDGGLPLKIVHGLAFNRCLGRVQLATGESQPVSLEELQALHEHACSRPEGVA
jgi:hypothetical protein